MDEHYITIQEAATTAGYRDDSVLHRAARKGTLKTRQFGPRARVTTRAWLEEYLASIKQRGTRRGQSQRREDDSADAAVVDTRARLRTFLEDWDAPGMDAYDALRTR